MTSPPKGCPSSELRKQFKPGAVFTEEPRHGDSPDLTEDVRRSYHDCGAPSMPEFGHQGEEIGDPTFVRRVDMGGGDAEGHSDNEVCKNEIPG